MVFYGFSEPPNIKFETNIGGEEGTDGARGTETGTIYFDIEKIKDAMTNKDTGGTSALIGLIAHESSHSEKYGENSGNLLIEEGFANSKEELARDKFKETDKTLSESEIKEALAKIKEEVKDERAISDSLTVSSKDEDVEGKGDDKKNILKKVVEKGNKLFQIGRKSINDFLDGVSDGITLDLGNRLFGQSTYVDYDSLDYQFGHFTGSSVVFTHIFNGLLSYKGKEELENSNLSILQKLKIK